MKKKAVVLYFWYDCGSFLRCGKDTAGDHKTDYYMIVESPHGRC